MKIANCDLKAEESYKVLYTNWRARKANSAIHSMCESPYISHGSLKEHN